VVEEEDVSHDLLLGSKRFHTINPTI
jgi:hypothetical protein